MLICSLGFVYHLNQIWYRLYLFNEGSSSEQKRAVVMVKWSVCFPSTPMIWVRIQLAPTYFFCKICVKKNEKTKKRHPPTHNWSITNLICLSLENKTFCLIPTNKLFTFHWLDKKSDFDHSWTKKDWVQKWWNLHYWIHWKIVTKC